MFIYLYFYLACAIEEPFLDLNYFMLHIFLVILALRTVNQLIKVKINLFVKVFCLFIY